ncbi:MAG: hypothetical protein OJF50_005712 [Nitrospira sp.]|jgi:flagellar motor protein MotB|nr:hypothetical protein [Nitrospira sp.]
MSETSVQDIYRALLIEQSIDLAREGSFEEAEKVLSEAKSLDEEDPILFDLQARFRAQQGRYREAEQFWKEAARLDPDNADYHAGLARVRALQERPYLAFPWLPVGAGILTVSILGFVGASLLSKSESVPDPGVIVTTTQAALPPSQPSPTPVKPVLKPPQLALTVPGVVLSTEDNTIIVRFEAGLFDPRTHLLPAARRTLTQVAQQLKTQEDLLRIEVVGHTNELPLSRYSPFTDNVDLGFQRAVVVTQTLRTAAGPQEHSFVISSRGDAEPPFHADTQDSRLRNRTVTLHIHKLQRS